MTASMKPRSSATRALGRLLPAMRERRVDVIVHTNRRTSTPKEKTMEPTAYSDTELADGRTDEELTIQSWQAEQLRRLGLSNIIAETFAGLVDWHEIAALVRRGCPPELALEIVR